MTVNDNNNPKCADSEPLTEEEKAIIKKETMERNIEVAKNLVKKYEGRSKNK